METPLTPQEQAEIDKLDKDLPSTKTIIELRSGITELLEAINNDRESNKREFEKGTEKFKELSEGQREQALGLNRVESEVSEMKTQIADGFKQQKVDLDRHLSETKDNQITELRKTIEKQDTDKTKRIDRRNAIKDGILIALVSGILIATAVYYLVPKE